MMLLRANCHSKLIATATRATKSHSLPHRLVQRRFSTTTICKINPVEDHEWEDLGKAIKNNIKMLNASDAPADYKYRNSKRLFAELDELTLTREIHILDAQHRHLHRALQKPVAKRRTEEGIPDPNLKRMAVCYRSLYLSLIHI